MTLSSNVEITSKSFGVTGWNEKGLTIIHLSLIFFILGWFLYLVSILFGLVHLMIQMSQAI